VVAFLLPASAVSAQLLTVRVVDTDGLPLGLTSVSVRSPAGDSAALITRLSGSDGTLRLTPGRGDIMVLARHVGFHADSVRVRVDTMVAPVTLRLRRIPQRLATLVVRESSDCSLASDAAAVDESLWDEVAKGIEVRRLINESYRYERRFTRVVITDPTIGPTRRRLTDTVEVNLPSVRDTAFQYRDGGYTARSGSRVNIRVFDEGDLTQASFLTFHCHGAPWRDTTDGSVRIAFAPRRGVRGVEDANRVRGTVIMDGTTWLTRAVSYEYVRDGKVVGRGRVDYTPVSVDNVVIAMPRTVIGDLRLPTRFGLTSTKASWTIETAYAGFTRTADPVR
jgi:hypothetical protein